MFYLFMIHYAITHDIASPYEGKMRNELHLLMMGRFQFFSAFTYGLLTQSIGVFPGKRLYGAL